MISKEFQRLPTSLQRHIYKLATYNPFRETELIERWMAPYAIVEVRATRDYKIQASWETDKDGNNAILHHIYVHRFTDDSEYLEPIMIYRPKTKVEILDKSQSEYLYDLIAIYRNRVMQNVQHEYL